MAQWTSPSSISRKHQLTQFKQPTLTVRVEERVREVVSVIFRYLEGLVFNAFIQVLWGWLIFRYLMQRHSCTLKGDLSVTLYFVTSVYWSVLETDPEQVFWQISPIIDAPVHAYESLRRWLVFHVRVVQACVQHDDREGKHVTRICPEMRWIKEWLCQTVPRIIKVHYYTSYLTPTHTYLWTERRQDCIDSSAGQRLPSFDRSSELRPVTENSTETVWTVHKDN